MKKKLLACLCLSLFSVCAFTGCGQDKASTNAEVAATVTAQDEAGLTEGINAPSADDKTSYDEIIAQLNDNQGYAFVDLGTSGTALLVSDTTFDDGNGNNASIYAIVYGTNPSGTIIQYGEVYSHGPAFPLAVLDGNFYCAGTHNIAKMYLDNTECTLTLKEEAREESTESGAQNFYYYNCDDDFSGAVADDTQLKSLFAEYGKATVINFMNK